MPKIDTENENLSPERVGPEGNLYHWAWTAKAALELLNPRDNLYAIAVEGLSTFEGNKKLKVKEEIADLTLYYGESDEFKKSQQCKIIQFKYSIASANTEFTASYLSKTIEKFSEQYAAHIKEHPTEIKDRKLSFVFATNRNSSENLSESIKYLKSGSIGKAPNAQAKTLLGYIKSTLKDEAAQKDFISRLEIEDSTGNLNEITSQYESRVIDWTPSEDVSSKLRALEALVQSKATSTGSKNNVIKRANLLNALGVLDTRELLPCPPYIEEVPKTLERPERLEAIKLLTDSEQPLIIHAEGGVGKTIFLRALQRELSMHNPAVFLDCFAGGNYRIVGESRHSPRKVGMHLINTLAFQGLCEPILPTAVDSEDYIHKVRRRLESVVQLLSKRRPGTELYIFIDAADNAAKQAVRKKELCFPSMLIESLSHSPIGGVKLIASCRSHRRDDTYETSEVSELQLRPFDKIMSDEFVLSKFGNATEIQKSICFTRSNGNGRVLAYLCEEWDREIANNETTDSITVEDLIEARVKDGRKTLRDKGASEEDVNVLFAALARLPLPLPITQLSGAINLTKSQVQSYCNDLVPLLEQTPEGVIFRDEPTDTWFGQNCNNTSSHLDALIERLTIQQSESSYAAIALPEILLESEKFEAALQLASSDEFPVEMKTSAAKRHLCEIRIRVALKLCALKDDVSSCIYLLAHLAVLTTANARCDSYISDNVDLIGGLENYENAKRVFDDYSGWNGARSARFCIYYAFSRSLDEAAAHLKTLSDWVSWHYDQEDRGSDKFPEPDHAELAAIPFYHCLRGEYHKAIHWVYGASPAYFRFSISQSLANYLRLYDEIYGTSFLNDTLNCAIKTHHNSSKEGDVIKEALLALYDEAAKTNQVDTKRVAARLKTGFKEFKADRDENWSRNYTSLQGALLDTAFKSVKYNKSSAKVLLKAANLSLNSDNDYFSNHSTKGFKSTLYSGVITAISNNQTVLRKHFFPPNYAKKRGAGNLADRSATAQFLKQKSSLARPIRKHHETKKKLDNSISTDDANQFAATVEIIFEAAQHIEKFINNENANTYSDLEGVLKGWNNSAPYGNYGYKGNELGRIKKSLFEEAVYCCFQELPDSEKSCAADDIYDLLTNSFHQNETYIKFIKVFAECEHTHEHAGKLSTYFSSKIDDLETVDERGTFSSHLAKAILPIDVDSAQAFFLDGLEKLDGVGVDDHDTVYGIMELAASHKGNPIPAEQAQRLMNLCESLIYDADKFGWPLFCSAAAQSFPWNGLARSQRWEFRDVVDIDYVNGVYAKKFVEKGILNPKRAAILYSLDEAVSYHSEYGPSRSDTLNTIINSAPSSEKPLVASFLVGITRHDKQIKKSSDEWKDICKNYGMYLIAKTQPLVPDIPANTLSMHPLGDECRIPKSKIERDDYHPTFSKETERKLKSLAKNINPLNVNAVDTALVDLRALKNYGRDDVGLMRELRKKVSLSDRADFLKVLQQVSQLDFYARILSFKETCDEWEKSSAFIKKNKITYTKNLLNVCLEDIFEGDSSVGYRLRQIAELSNISLGEIALLALKYSAKQNVEVYGRDAFTLAVLLMKDADGENGRKAVIEILSSSALKVDSEKSEGISDVVLEAPQSEIEAISQLLWVRLGHDNKLMKWRAIYALVAMFEFELADDIESLIKLYEENPRTPYHVPEQKYCVWNAREAFMIALRRVALKTPEKLFIFEEWIKSLAIANTDHIVINKLAAETLYLMEQSKSSPDKKLLAALKDVGKPVHGYRDKNDEDYNWEKDKEDLDFYFEYDFDKYGPSRFGHLFGYAKPQASKVIVDKVKSIDPHIERMTDTGGRRRYDSYNGRVDTNKIEYYGEQLVRHSMVLASSELLKTNPIVKANSEDECPWEEWQERYRTTFSDGYLLSDGTDIDIAALTNSMLEGERKDQTINIDDTHMKKLIGWSKKSEPVCIAGHWSTTDDCRVSIKSCVIDSYGAIGHCQKLAKNEWFDVWVPYYESYYEEPRSLPYAFRDRAKTYKPWIVLPERNTGIDDIDSYACSKAIERYEPSGFLVRALNLKPSCRFKKIWKNARDTEVMTSEAWGTDSHKLAPSDDRDGKRLLLRKTDCIKLLKSKRKKIVYVLKVERYGSSKEWEEKSTLRRGFIILVDEHSNLRTWKIKEPKPRKG